MAGDITWTNERRKLSDLRPQEDNPRQIKKAQAKRLVKSFDEFSQVGLIAINPDGTILNGHQRYYVLQAAYPDNGYEVDVRVASRSLSRREWQKLTVYLHEGATGEWNFDGLAEWDGVGVADLVEWGFDEGALIGTIFNDGDPDSAGGIRPWDTLKSLKGGLTVRVIIGEVETVLNSLVYDDLFSVLSASADPRLEFENIITQGLVGENSNSG